MASEKINRWLTLAANVGVIAGLILVAIQINQNTQITKTQIANDYYLADMALELAMMGENPAHAWQKAVYAPGELTVEDAKDDYPEEFRAQVDGILASGEFSSNREMLDSLMPETRQIRQ